MFAPFLTTGIGSLPHSSPQEACRLILEAFDIPFWPQLPLISFRESMIPQYSEGMPFLKVDQERGALWIERSSSDDLDRFYESCTDNSRISISEDHASGLHEFLRAVRIKNFDYLKGHVTGPLTFTLGLKDSEGRAIYFDEELREISLMLLKAKIRWQYDVLKPFAKKVIIFVDEPILSAIGTSAYLGVSSEEVLRLLREITGTITSLGGMPGIHCCGNADWPLVMKTGAAILNFDAYDYSEQLSIYYPELKDFLSQGGMLAWGIVPTSDAIRDETFESIRRRFEAAITKFTGKIPEDLLLSKSLITPSCGTGSRSIEETIKIFQILIRLKEEMS